MGNNLSCPYFPDSRRSQTKVDAIPNGLMHNLLIACFLLGVEGFTSIIILQLFPSQSPRSDLPWRIRRLRESWSNNWNIIFRTASANKQCRIAHSKVSQCHKYPSSISSIASLDGTLTATRHLTIGKGLPGLLIRSLAVVALFAPLCSLWHWVHIKVVGKWRRPREQRR